MISIAPQPRSAARRIHTTPAPHITVVLSEYSPELFCVFDCPQCRTPPVPSPLMSLSGLSLNLSLPLSPSLSPPLSPPPPSLLSLSHSLSPPPSPVSLSLSLSLCLPLPLPIFLLSLSLSPSVPRSLSFIPRPFSLISHPSPLIPPPSHLISYPSSPPSSLLPHPGV